MDEAKSYYRILINSGSLYRKLVATAIFSNYFLAVWFWPFYLPPWLNLSLTVLAFILLVHGFIKRSEPDRQVLFLTYDGRLKSAQGAGLLDADISPSSYVLPWCVQLHLVSKLDQSSQWLTLYNDQVEDNAIRRLRRSIFRAKQLA
mgnify:CR=1 FL=1